MILNTTWKLIRDGQKVPVRLKFRSWFDCSEMKGDVVPITIYSGQPKTRSPKQEQQTASTKADYSLRADVEQMIESSLTPVILPFRLTASFIVPWPRDRPNVELREITMPMQTLSYEICCCAPQRDQTARKRWDTQSDTTDIQFLEDPVLTCSRRTEHSCVFFISWSTQRVHI